MAIGPWSFILGVINNKVILRRSWSHRNVGPTSVAEHDEFNSIIAMRKAVYK